MGLAQTHTQKQHQRITAHLAQSAQLLHASRADLERYLQEQTERNPFLSYTSPIATTTTDPLAQLSSDTGVSLDEHLFNQLQDKTYPKTLQPILMALISCLDNNGYCYQKREALAAKLHCSPAEIDAGLALIKQCDPAGIGASSVQECLKLQLQRRTPTPQLALTIVTDYFTALSTRDWPTLLTALNVTEAALHAALQTIQALNPRPAAAFTRAVVPIIIPDLIITATPRGQHCQLATPFTAALQFDTAAFEHFQAKATDKQTQRFLSQQEQHYRTLQHVLTYREERLLALGQLILTTQCAFFQDHRTTALIPWEQQQAAQALAVHPSTISRLVNEKFLSFAGHLYPLQAFFPQSPSQQIPKQTTRQIHDLIAQLIATEDKKSPLSDQQLAQALKQQGLPLSRRVIAKYRHQLNIPSSYQRKQR